MLFYKKFNSKAVLGYEYYGEVQQSLDFSVD